MNNTIEGTITDTTGPIYAERNGARIELNKGDGVFESDIIITGSETTADIEYRDGTKSRIAPNTKFKLTDYEFGPADDEPSFIVDLTEGAIRTVTGEIVKLNPDAFEVVTPLATVGIRGTEFTVESDENGTSASAYYVTEEKPMVITDSNGQQVELSQPYQMVNVASDGSGAPLEVNTLTRDGLIEAVGEDYASLVTQIPTSAQSQGQWDSTNSAMTYATENSQDRATDGEVEDEENLENQSSTQEASSTDSEEGEASPATEQATSAEEDGTAQESSTAQTVAEVAPSSKETEEAEDIVTEALQSNQPTLTSTTSSNSSLLDNDASIIDSIVSPEAELPQTTPFDQVEAAPPTSQNQPSIEPSDPTQPPVDPTPPPTEPVKQYAVPGHFDVFDDKEQIRVYNSEINDYETNNFFTQAEIDSLSTAPANYHARLSGLQIFKKDLELGAGNDGLYVGSKLDFKNNSISHIQDGTYSQDSGNTIVAALHSTEVNTGKGEDVVNVVMYSDTGGTNCLLYDSTLSTGEDNDTVTLSSSWNGAHIGMYNSTIDLGNGDDTVSLGSFGSVVAAVASMKESTIEAGNGNDTINLSGNIIKSTINAGEGDDTITLIPDLSSSKISEISDSTIDTGNGDDKVTITGNITNTEIHLGHGNNSLILNGDLIPDSTGLSSLETSINAGGGDDTIIIKGNLGEDDVTPDTFISLQDGNNTVEITGNMYQSSSITTAGDTDKILVTGSMSGNITTAGGDDIVVIQTASTGKIDTGAGNDVIYQADMSKVDPSLNPTISDSAGIDVLITNTKNLYINSSSNQGMEIVISGVESDDFTSLKDLGVVVEGSKVEIDENKWQYDSTNNTYNSLSASESYILSFTQLTVDSNDSYTLTLNSQNP